MFLKFFLFVVFGFFFLLLLIYRVVEPAYVFLFNKPLYVHWYPFARKLNVSQRQILISDFPFYNTLSSKRKIYFEHRINVFLDKYEFIGKDMIVTEQMRVLIAGTYIMLTFGMRNYLITLFNTILIYPTSYFSTVNQLYHKGEFNPRMKTIAFSWEDFLLGHSTTNDNINLGLHEFTHALHFHCLRSNDPSATIFYDEFNEVEEFKNDSSMKWLPQPKIYFGQFAVYRQNSHT